MLTRSPGFLPAAICSIMRKAVLADAAIDRDILIGKLGGAALGGRRALGRRQRQQRAQHVVQRPAQVDRGRPGREQRSLRRAQRRVGRIGSASAAPCRRRRRRRSAAHRAPTCRGSRSPCRRRVSIVIDPEFVRQPALVDDVDGAAVGIGPDRAVVAIADFHCSDSLASSQRRGDVAAVDRGHARRSCARPAPGAGTPARRRRR